MQTRGFVDIQVNGLMGTDFGAEDLTAEQVLAVTRDLVGRGTIAYCPTVITGDPTCFRTSLAAIAAAMQVPGAGAHILGIHLEGPFISPEPGAVGAHPKDYVIDPDPALFDQFQEWAGGNIRLLTLAPERPGAIELIEHAVAGGVTVSIGHHLADDDTLRAAVQAGASLHTHVCNGIPNEIHRHNNPLWWVLADDSISGMFITDGHHLPADFIAVALRAKTVARFIVTSDASPLAGMPPGNYTLFNGLPVTITPEGMIASERSQSLAGAHLTAFECMNHLASLGILAEDELIQVGVTNPLRALGFAMDRLDGLQGPDVEFDGSGFLIRS